MATFSRILCLFGRHARSRGHARRVDDGWRSRCRRCGKPMVKTDEGKWTIEPVADGVASAGPVAEAAPAARSGFRRWPLARRRKPEPPATG